MGCPSAPEQWQSTHGLPLLQALSMVQLLAPGAWFVSLVCGSSFCCRGCVGEAMASLE